MNQVIVGSLCLAIGVGVGYMLAAGDDEAARGDGANTRAHERAQQRAGENRHFNLTSEPTGDSGIPLDGGEDLVTVPVTLIRGITNTSPITSCRQDLFRKDDPVEGLLKITAHEKEEMQQVWDKVRVQVEALEVKSSRSQVNEDDSVTIVVPDLSQSLGPVGDGFGAELEEVLGSERGRLFLAMKQIEKVFRPESGERKHHISVESVGDGTWRYHMTYEDANERRVWVGDGIPNEIRHLTDAVGIRSSLMEALSNP